ncbi:hypothetical protein N431DRAFT_235696 [Stipitochalara longipes BDJ]|nr:hypothetical protein N431DRAFT_235696 [Stipitochalara longipes BDJ]
MCHSPWIIRERIRLPNLFQAALTFLPRSSQHDGTHTKPALRYQNLPGSPGRSGFLIQSNLESILYLNILRWLHGTLAVQWSRLTSKFRRCGCLRSWKQGQTTSLRIKTRRGHSYISTASPWMAAHALQDLRIVLKYGPSLKRRLATAVKMLDESATMGPSTDHNSVSETAQPPHLPLQTR